MFLPRKLKEAMNDCGVGISELARQTKISRNRIHELLDCEEEADLKVSTLEAFSKALKKDPSFFLT